MGVTVGRGEGYNEQPLKRWGVREGGTSRQRRAGQRERPCQATQMSGPWGTLAHLSWTSCGVLISIAPLCLAARAQGWERTHWAGQCLG